MAKIADQIEKMGETVTEGYKKIESGVVEGYTKIEDKFIDTFLAKEGETMEQARRRLKEQQK